MNRAVSLLVVLGCVTAAGLISPTNASAASAECPGDDGYSVSNWRPTNRDAVPPMWLGPGMSGSISLQAGRSVTTTIGGSGSYTGSAIVAEAKVEISGSIAWSRTASVPYSGSGSIPSTWTRGGYIHAGSHAYTYSWRHWSVSGRCTTSTLGSGTATSPTAMPAFWRTQA